MTKLLIDADGCPVVDEAIFIAQQFANVQCIILCDTSHHFEKAGAETIMVDKGADSVDFALVNLVQPNDIVITQDYGLAAMCLAKTARVISQDGLEYTADNIDALLLARYNAKKIRNAGGKLKGQPKRKATQDRAFMATLTSLLS